MEPAEVLVVRLDGFEGPMDLLLELARGQKVDLARISILSLVEQYLAIVEGARQVRLDLAADWLVMAAWLTWLKSRLLLPPGSEAAEEGEEAAEVLAERLQALQAVQELARWLGARPQLGHDVFARGAPESLVAVDRVAARGRSAGADCAPIWRRGAGPRRARRISRGGGRSGRCRRHWRCWDGCWAGPCSGRRWSTSCRRCRSTRCSAGRRWRARCWPGWSWRGRAVPICGKTRSSAPSCCGRRRERRVRRGGPAGGGDDLRQRRAGGAAALARLLPESDRRRAGAGALQERYAGRGVELVEVAGGWQFRTAADLAPALTRVVQQPRRLPRAAMETLAVIAYHQPVTRTEIETVRGASLGQGVMDALLEAGLIEPRGRKDVPGRPTLWGTTPAFLAQFGLGSLRDLPRREDLLTEPGG